MNARLLYHCAWTVFFREEDDWLPTCLKHVKRLSEIAEQILNTNTRQYRPDKYLNIRSKMQTFCYLKLDESESCKDFKAP